EPIRRVLDEGIVWEERWISPLAVRFSQGKIHPFFHERGPISEVMLQIKLKAEEGKRSKRIEPPFPPVRLLHLKEQGVLVTLDNRRLYALQRFALQEWPTPCLVRALCVDELTPTRLRAENRKFTNRLCGLQLEVESRSNAFDTFSWVTEAAQTEAPRFCRLVALRAYDRAVSLLPVLVVHSLLCQKLRPYLRARWPLLRFLAVSLPSPQKREFASKRVLLQHILELSKPTGEVLTCPRVCVGYKAETVVALGKGRSCVSSKLSVERPLSLLQAPGPLSRIQRRVLSALLPMSCLPYVRSSLRGAAQDWIMGFLLAWGKAWAQLCELGKVGGRAKPGFLGGCRFQAAAFATPMRGAPPLFSFLLSRQAYHTSRQAIDRSL
ncbi:Slc47a1, partial [Symbiodinium pilosum]